MPNTPKARSPLPLPANVSLGGGDLARPLGDSAGILLADHPLPRVSLARLIASQSDMHISAEAGTPGELLACLRRNTPDLIVLDLSLGQVDGLKIIKSLVCLDPRLRILALSIQDEKYHASRTLEAGAKGYMRKQSSEEALLRAIRSILSKETPLIPSGPRNGLMPRFTE